MNSDINASDFLSRSQSARALALVAKQSSLLNDEAEVDRAVSEKLVEIERNESMVFKHWTVYRVEPDKVEFWQGDTKRHHKRLRYEQTGKNNFQKNKLWP